MWILAITNEHVARKSSLRAFQWYHVVVCSNSILNLFVTDGLRW